MSDKGPVGMSGPAGMTDFEIGQEGFWGEKHIQLQNLCLPIAKFIQENPKVVSKVTITKDSIKSYI